MPILTLPYTADTLTLADHFRHLPYFLLLDSGHLGPDIFSALPLQWCEQTAFSAFVIGDLQTSGSYDRRNITSSLEQELQRMHQQLPAPASTDMPWQPAVMGLLSYEAGYEYNFIAPLLDSTPFDYAPSQFGSYCWAIVVDHEAQHTQLHIGDNCPQWLAEQVSSLVFSPAPQPLPFHIQAPFDAKTTKTRYLKDVTRILQYIDDGDCYQVNYTQKFSAPCTGDGWEAFKTLRNLSETPFGAFLDTGKEQILSHSPERFIQIRQRAMTTQPIKGTVKRGKDPQEDATLAQQLMNSAKDRAENVMIVDLLRNDLGRSAVPGSVNVPSLFALESYRNVHHLVSTVRAQLLPHLSPIDGVLRAFPGGSITGAPKKRAMEIIHELEPHQRGPYCGSLFYWNAQDTLDSNILIRTLVIKDNCISVWGGGGIVADSDPEMEFEESLTKVSYLMTALEGD